MSKIRIFVVTISLIAFMTSSIYAEGSKTLLNDGKRALADQNYAKAAELFKRSLAEEGESVDCLNNLGFALHHVSKKYINEAYKEYKKAIKLDPKNEETLEYLGSLYISQGNLMKAAQVVKQLKAIESAEAETLNEKLKKVVAQLKKIKKMK